MKKLLNISLGTVCPASLERAAGTNENVPLARLYGEARDIKINRKGNDTILGDFRGINLETGEEFASSVLYLPRGLHETVIVAMDFDHKGANTVRFAFDIWAEPEPQRKSYNIAFADLMENKDKPDPLANFAEAMAANSQFGKPTPKK